jgi:hypothetical protein
MNTNISAKTRPEERFFDWVEATKLLHSDQIKVIIDCMEDPIWP